MPPRRRTTSRARFRPTPEGLESRSLLSGLSPTPIEELYLQELDDARFSPAAYGIVVGVDLSAVAPSQPLAMNTQLVASARGHSADMVARNYFDHYTPEGIGPSQRVEAAGFADQGVAESIETNTQEAPGFPPNYAALDTASSLADLIVDSGVPNLGHRVMLLDIGGGLASFRQVGIGVAAQDSAMPAPFQDYTQRTTDTTIDLAKASDTDPFLTGVVFNDQNADGLYTPGEGLGGVTISVAGVGTTATLDAGGYAIQLAPGTYTVTASGGGLASPISRTVVIGSSNQRLNFDANPNGAELNAPGGAASGVLGTFAPIRAGDTPGSYSARIDWGDGHASPATIAAGSGGTFVVTGSNTYATNGNYAVRVLITRLADGSSLALNATAVVTGAAQGGGPGLVPGGGQGAGTGAGTGSGTGATPHGAASHRAQHGRVTLPVHLTHPTRRVSLPVRHVVSPVQHHRPARPTLHRPARG